MAIQRFRTRYERKPNEVVDAVFYDGTNLSDLFDLGAQFQVDDRRIMIRYHIGYMTRLPSHVWVVMHEDNRDLGGVVFVGERTFARLYGEPLTDEQVIEIERQAAEPEHIVGPGPNRTEVVIYADDRAGLHEAALAEGRAIFGENVALTVEFDEDILPSYSTGKKGKYFTRATISVHS
jgi:hypothetical protein